MLDITNNITLFAAKTEIDVDVEKQPQALLIRGCNIYIFSAKRVYSEFDEMTFDSLNANNYNCGALEVEFTFLNNITKNAYPEFYTKCFVVRTDNGVCIKPMKVRNNRCASKINPKGELVTGIRYYFQNEKEIKSIQDCNRFMIEGFIALDNPKNVFGVMCQLERKGKEWEIVQAYTYKPDNAKSIKYLMD